jgi:hypothetical protein
MFEVSSNCCYCASAWIEEDIVVDFIWKGYFLEVEGDLVIVFFVKDVEVFVLVMVILFEGAIDGKELVVMGEFFRIWIFIWFWIGICIH